MVHSASTAEHPTQLRWMFRKASHIYEGNKSYVGRKFAAVRLLKRRDFDGLMERRKSGKKGELKRDTRRHLSRPSKLHPSSITFLFLHRTHAGPPATSISAHGPSRGTHATLTPTHGARVGASLGNRRARLGMVVAS